LSEYKPWETSCASNFDAERDNIEAGMPLEPMWKEVATEKINITKDALANLSHVLRDDLTQEDVRSLYERELPSVKV